MQNFLGITHLDVLPVLARLHKLNPPTWKPVEARGETNNPVIGKGASYLLRGHDKITKANWLEDLPVKDLPELLQWASMRQLLDEAKRAVMATDLAKALLTGDMARAMISRLDPGPLFWHVDDGPYHARTARFHVALVTNPLCKLYSLTEDMHVPVGMLVWFNNHVWHCATNFSPNPKHYRLHLVFEMYRQQVAGNA